MAKTIIQDMSTENLELIIAESGKQFWIEREPITKDECSKCSIYGQIFNELEIRKQNAPNKDI